MFTVFVFYSFYSVCIRFLCMLYPVFCNRTNTICQVFRITMCVRACVCCMPCTLMSMYTCVYIWQARSCLHVFVGYFRGLVAHLNLNTYHHHLDFNVLVVVTQILISWKIVVALNVIACIPYNTEHISTYPNTMQRRWMSWPFSLKPKVNKFGYANFICIFIFKILLTL